MRNTFTINVARTALVAFLALGISAVALPQTKDAKSTIKDQIEQSQKAATVFSEIMDAPDKGIPKNLIDTARCVAVFPSVLKAGFIVGGRGGRGVASCRTATGWTAPAYFNLGGGSFGLQIGADSTDFVMLMMNDKGMNSLLSDQFTLGGDASVAAGPVGRQAGAETDAKLNAEILSYSRSKGAFAGLELKGVVIKPDKDDMKEVYGGSVTAKDVLNGNKVATPPSVLPFPTMLGRYSAGVAAKPGSAK
jgi:lipid-binding SYLF domain-containing protein